MDHCPPERLPETLGLSEEFETAYEPVGDVAVSHDAATGRAEIRYVALDPLPPRRFWPQDGSRGRLVPLRAREAATEAAGAPLALPVRVSPDGARIALPTGGTRDGTHLYVPPPAQSGRHDLLDWSRRQVAAYDSWKRGEVYGIVREMVLIGPGGEAESLDVSPDWLRLDLDGAREALADAVSAVPETAPFRP